MIIGVPKEVKVKESRGSVTPDGVRKLVNDGHTVYVETNAGHLTGYPNPLYEEAGATIVPNGESVWSQSELIVKVKEPIESEYRYFHKDVCVFTFLHLASVPKLVEAMCESGMMGIGYETVEMADGHLPLLFPMSEVAGKMQDSRQWNEARS